MRKGKEIPVEDVKIPEPIDGLHFRCQKCGRVVPERDIKSAWFKTKSGSEQIVVCCETCAKPARLRTPYISIWALKLLDVERMVVYARKLR